MLADIYSLLVIASHRSIRACSWMTKTPPPPHYTSLWLLRWVSLGFLSANSVGPTLFGEHSLSPLDVTEHLYLTSHTIDSITTAHSSVYLHIQDFRASPLRSCFPSRGQLVKDLLDAKQHIAISRGWCVQFFGKYSGTFLAH
jgi:hypothetical protein